MERSSLGVCSGGVMDASSGRSQLVALVETLPDWQVVFVFRLVQVLRWPRKLWQGSAVGTSGKTVPVLRIEPIVPGSGVTDISLNHVEA